ncbi:MAG: hypothetical protein ACR2OM_12075 [Aestuariivirgaceae bacterium]
MSTFNGKVEGAGGYYEDDTTNSDGRGHVAASLSLPLGCMWGLQIDGGYGAIGDAEGGGVGAHLFTRDPESYLLGVYGSYSNVDDIINNDIFRIGGEAEFYLGQLSFEALVGYEDADVNGDNWFAAGTAAFYATDDVRIYAGYRHFLSVDTGVVGLEWQPHFSGLPLTVFTEGQIGSDDFASVLGGVRFYFGSGDTSLKRRHREDDPANLMMNLLTNVCGGRFPAAGGMMADGKMGDGAAPGYVDSCGNSLGGGVAAE